MPRLMLLVLALVYFAAGILFSLSATPLMALLPMCGGFLALGVMIARDIAEATRDLADDLDA